jgi:hypothetical protein
LLTIAGTGSWQVDTTPANIIDTYVPAGSNTFHVGSTAGFAVGDTVLIERPITGAWIAFMGMDTLVRDGQQQTWLSNSPVRTDRLITAIAGDRIVVDAPLSESLLPAEGARVVRYTFANRIENVGVQSLRMRAPSLTVPLSEPTFGALQLNAVQNAWVKDVRTEEFSTGIDLGATAKWITVEDASISHLAPVDAAAGYPFQVSVAGQLTLVHRLTTVGDDSFAYATQTRTPGPNVLLNSVSQGTHNAIDPHQRWGTGLLVDSAEVSEIDLRNRGNLGSGHGWTMGFGVVWNSRATKLLVQHPPGAPNWLIGSSGTLVIAAAPGATALLPSGIVDALGQPVSPKSLYLAQLCARKGLSAVRALGYPAMP